jgi:hypothetical protein
MSSRVPRKQRNLKAAASASAAAGVELNSSECTEDVTLEAASKYELFGFGKSGQTYVQGETTDFASVKDDALQTTGKATDGATANIKDASDLINRSISNALPTNGNNYYFSTTSTGVTGSSVVNFVYGQSGPQAPYIPQLVHGSQGLAASQKWVFFLPSSITGSGGSNMPVNHSRSFEITIAGAVAEGEKVQVYTASAPQVYVATGSAFSYSAAVCETPNYSHQTIRIPTSSLSSANGAGIMVAYTSSYTVDGTKDNTPRAGVVVIISPSALL